MELTPDKWQRVKALFDRVLERPPAERESFLASICPEEDLREQVRKLLINQEQAGSFLSQPTSSSTALKNPTWPPARSWLFDSKSFAF